MPDFKGYFRILKQYTSYVFLRGVLQEVMKEVLQVRVAGVSLGVTTRYEDKRLLAST